MAIFRGVGGSGSSSDNSFLQEVTAQATTATTKASEASASATSASASATSAANSLATIQNTEVTSASFNTSDGVLTLTKLGGATVTADLDGRFLTSYTETNDLSSAVTWVNVPNAYITAGSVTQHQAALTITESQISDLQSYLTSYTETNNLTTAVTWANVPDANITQSSVTQHQGALSITESQISDLQTYLTAETNDLSTTVTWANVPDANITESSVTQHQAALSVTESQISDLGTYLTASDISGKANLSGATFTGDVSIGTPPSGTQSLTVAGTTNLHGGVTGGLDVTGDITVTGTVDGVDIATRDAVLTSTTTTANSAMQDLVDDTTPELGGDLNLNSKTINGTGRLYINQASASTPAIHLINGDTSDAASPTIRLERFSTTTVDDDSIGKIEFYGYKESLPPIFPTVEYANITGVINDGTNLTIDGQLDFNLAKDDTLTTVMSLTPTTLELPNGTNLDVAGHVEAREAQIGSGKTGSFDDNYSTGTKSSSSDTKTVNIGTGYVNGGTTTINIAPTAPTTTKTINLNAHTNVTGDITVTGTVDGRDVATDGARLDTIPYHRVKHTQLRADNQILALVTAYSHVGLYDTIVHPATPVECARYLDLNIAIRWNYVSSNTNDLFLQLQMTVPTGGGTVTNIGTATRANTNNPEYNSYTNFAWYYVSGDYTHLFTEFGRINTTGNSSSSEGIITAWKYDSVNNRTYLMTYDNPGVSFNTGDTFYYSPYAFESAGATLTVTKDIDERYVSSGAQPHSFKFKTSYDDAALSYKLQMKEYTTADSGTVLGTTVTFTDVEEL